VTVPDSVNAALQAAALVTRMAFQVIIGAAIGAWLDGWFETSPALVLALGGVGFITGMFVVWRAFAQAQDSAEPDDQSEDPPKNEPRP